jgi:hypothetical protein
MDRLSDVKHDESENKKELIGLHGATPFQTWHLIYGRQEKSDCRASMADAFSDVKPCPPASPHVCLGLQWGHAFSDVETAIGLSALQE